MTPGHRVGQGSYGEPPSRPATILVVEDEGSVRMVIARSLQRHGYRVVEASSGTEAAELLRDEGVRIDLLLSDFALPGLSGLELVQLAKKVRPGLRALLSSGYFEDAISCRGAPADLRLLPKPFEQSQLLTAVRAALEELP